MQATAGAVALQIRNRHGFCCGTLTGKGGIAMDEEAHDLFPLGITALDLFGPDLAENHRVDGFKV